MTDQEYKKITKSINKILVKRAKKNDWMWFYNLHIKEVVDSAIEIMKLYKANEQIVILSAWLHDISLFNVVRANDLDEAHRKHHLDSFEETKKILKNHNLNEKDKIAICDCVLRHRNKDQYQPISIEEKVLAVADAMSHFRSIYYFTYFKFHPKDSFETMLKMRQKQIEKDWEKMDMLPKAKKLVKDKYLFFKEMCDNYI